MLTLESLVEDVGPFGRFQKMLIPLSFSSVIISVMSMLFMVFGAVEPDWRCVARDGHQANQSDLFFGSNEVNGSGADGGVTWPPFWEGGDENTMKSGSGDNATGGFSAEPTFRACEGLRIGGDACQRVVFSSGMRTIITEFQLVCDLDWVPSLTISVQMIGVLVGSFLAGQLADSLGRKKTMVGFTALHATLNLVAAFSINWQMFAALRSAIGVMVGGLLVVSFPYCTEFIGVQWRALVATLPFWGLGSLAFSLLCWALPHWQYLHLAIAAATLACLPVWIFLPESVRWLTVKSRMPEAHQVLCQMARWNGRRPPSLSSVQALKSEKSHQQDQKKYNYFHIFSTAHIMRVSCLVGFMWFSASMMYYGISFGIKNLSGDFHLNFFLMVLMETPAPLLVYHVSSWLGRRWATFGGFLIVASALLAVVPVTLLLSEAQAGSYVTVLCIVARFSLGFSWSLMTLFHAELYPTVVRNIGLGYCNTVARFGGIVAPYLAAVREPYMLYAILGGVMILTALVPLLLPETRGQPLRDELEVTPRKKDAGKDRTNGVEMSAISA